MEAARRIIGGMFGLAEPLEKPECMPVFLKGQPLLLANARSGLAVILKALRPPRIWLPSYICDVVVAAVGCGPSVLRFYEVGEDLNIVPDGWLDQVGQGDLLLLVDYFGFPGSGECAYRAKAQGAWVLEDACQALLSDGMDAPVDFVLYSLRKFVGVPDGGVLIQRDLAADFKEIQLHPAPEEWWLKAFRAAILRRDFDYSKGERRWFELFRTVEGEQPFGQYAMSELTRLLLTHSFDFAEIALRRIENYHTLAEVLNRWALYPHLPPGVVPLGFPIRIPHRDQIREALFDRQVYPPVHWPVPDAVPTEHQACRRLAAEIMTLPCDQRYSVEDMRWMAQVVLEAEEEWN
jgi:hypothetical protein